MLSHAGDNQSDLNTLIDPCAEPEVGPSVASTSSVLDKSRSDKMDSPLHTPCLIDLDCDITIETMVILETQLDTSTSDFLASVPTGIIFIYLFILLQYHTHIRNMVYNIDIQ